MAGRGKGAGLRPGLPPRGPRPGAHLLAAGTGCVPPGGAAASTGPRAPARWAPRPPSARTWVAPSPSVWSAGRTASSDLRTSSTGRCWARAASARPSRYRARQAGMGLWVGAGGQSVCDPLVLHPPPTSVPRKPQQMGIWLPDSLARALLHLGLPELVRGRGLTIHRP